MLRYIFTQFCPQTPASLAKLYALTPKPGFEKQLNGKMINNPEAYVHKTKGMNERNGV